MPLTSPLPSHASRGLNWSDVPQLGTRQGRLVAPAQIAPTTDMKLTGQQDAICGAVNEGHRDIVVEALAGTGKTSTLVAISRQQLRRPGVYLAFNKSVAIEAGGKFPDWIHVSTAHGLAYQAIGKDYGNRLPGNPGASRMGANQMASIMRVKPVMLDTGTINPVHLVRMAQATVNAFMKTADPEVLPRHIPSRCLVDHSPHDLGEAILTVARRIWQDLSSTTGRFRFTHDVYLKLWQLGTPRLPFDYIMFDEAQDADPVIASIVNRQQVQRLWVGDRNQAIYGWRGAVDAMSKVVDAKRYPLTKSWRFGDAIADEANKWLDLLGSQWKVEGNSAIRSTIGEVTIPRAILCRGNGTALGWVLKFHEQSIPVALAPGDKNAGKDIERFAWAARDLMKPDADGTDHPDLVGFTNWAQLIKHVDEEEDTDDLKRLVGIIVKVGVSAVIDAVRGCVTEDRAMITVSTAHKAKGLEWSSVRVADDFVPPCLKEGYDPTKGPDTEAMMLNYVTVTRAKERIELGALSEPEMWA